MSVNNLSDHASLFDKPHVKKVIWLLSYLGSWPDEVLGKKTWFADFRNPKILFPVWSMGLLLGMSYVKKNTGNLTFFDQGHLYISIFMTLIGLQRMTMTWTQSYKNTMYNFYNKFNLIYHKDKSEFAMKTYKEVDKLSSFFCTLFYAQLCIGVTLYNLTPLYNNFQHGMFDTIKPVNGTYEHAYYYYLPFDYTTNFNGFLVVCIVNIFYSSDIAASICVHDFCIFTIILNLWGHVKILKNNLKCFPRPEMKSNSGSIKNSSWYTEAESRNIANLLIESVEHYKIIRKFMDEVSSAFGCTICFYLFIHQISGCILLTELSQLTVKAIGSCGALTYILFQQLVQISLVFEVIGSQSETIKDAVYELPWECMDNRNRKILLFYLCNVQKTMHLKAMGILPVGVRTMASILKTSVSYFMLLRTSTVVQD